MNDEIHACPGCQSRWNVGRSDGRSWMYPGTPGEDGLNPVWERCGECQKDEEKAAADLAALRAEVADLSARVTQISEQLLALASTFAAFVEAAAPAPEDEAPAPEDGPGDA